MTLNFLNLFFYQVFESFSIVALDQVATLSCCYYEYTPIMATDPVLLYPLVFLQLEHFFPSSAWCCLHPNLRFTVVSELTQIYYNTSQILCILVKKYRDT